jgi:hypothetical protein
MPFPSWLRHPVPHQPCPAVRPRTPTSVPLSRSSEIHDSPLSALCLKAYAYAGRLHARDAIDIWRLLEAAAGSGVDSAAWPTGATGKDAARILHRSFGSIGSQALRHVSGDRAIQTRVRALVQQIVPSVLSWD